MVIRLESISFYKLNEYLMELTDQGAKLIVRTYNGALLTGILNNTSTQRR